MAERTRLILVRHGNTKIGDARIAGGTSNVPLSNLGHQQAIDLEVRLGDERIDVVYASHLQRAIDTALPAASRRKLEVLRSPLLVERSFGPFEDLTDPVEVEAARERLGNFWNSSPVARRDERVVPGMETDSELLGRVESLVDKIARGHGGQTVLAATHYDLIATYLQRLGYKRYAIGNTDFVKIDISNPRSPNVVGADGIIRAS